MKRVLLNGPASVGKIDLLFDLDGTLTDPGIGITRSLNHALTTFGRPERSAAELRGHIGPPIDAAFRALTGLTTPEEIAPFVAAYRERYFAVGFRENCPYDGVAAALADLAAADRSMAVCTSKRVDVAERILSAFDLARFFRFVDGGDVGVHKWQQIAELRADGLVDETTTMIGDRAVDVQAAQRNELASAVVTWGYGTTEELTAAHPDRWLHAPADLRAFAQ